MSICDSSSGRVARRAVVAVIALIMFVVFCPALYAQNDNWNTRAVGGISVDASGVLDNATLDDTGSLSRFRARLLQAVPDDLNRMADLRKVSLKGLEAAIRDCIENKKNLPDEINYLAGLQQIHYVFVYPEQNDIVLVGPGEGWKVDAQGNVVGVTTGRPVIILDDLLVALRSARAAARIEISCSIDPTSQGLTRLRGHVSKLRTIGNPQRTATGIENALGPQQITVTGVPETSHFARVMVAADYRMKRLAMNFESAPIRGLPSFLHMMKATGSGMRNMLPRWWLAPQYEPLLRDADGLAWELRGAAVKAMTEEDFLTTSGARQHTGRTNPVAQKWADNMTEKYDELAVADPIFGQLRNCMELAIVAALIVKENLTAKAGYSMPTLMGPENLNVVRFPSPKQVDSKASVLRKGRKWLISASGGVKVNSWAIADKVEQSDSLAPVRSKAAAKKGTSWWWN